MLRGDADQVAEFSELAGVNTLWQSLMAGGRSGGVALPGESAIRGHTESVTWSPSSCQDHLAEANMSAFLAEFLRAPPTVGAFAPRWANAERSRRRAFTSVLRLGLAICALIVLTRSRR